MKQHLVKYQSRNPNDSGVTERFRSRTNFSLISSDEIQLVINNLVVDDGNGFSYSCLVITSKFSTASAVVELIVRGKLTSNG